MPDRDPSHEPFRQAADRRAYERQQLLQHFSEQTRNLVADMAKKAEEEKQHLQRQQQERYRDDVEKEKARIEREQPQLVHTPHGTRNRKLNKREIQERAENKVKAAHKAELETVDKKLERGIAAIAARHAPEKKRELDKEREAVQQLAAEKRRDRQATRLDRDDRSSGTADKESKSRSEEERRERVEARIRKAKERSARSREHDHERD